MEQENGAERDIEHELGYQSEIIRHNRHPDSTGGLYPAVMRVTGKPGAEYNIDNETRKGFYRHFYAMVSTTPGDEYLIFTRPGRPVIVNASYSDDERLDGFLLFHLDQGARLPAVQFGKPWKLNSPSFSLATPPVSSVLVGGTYVSEKYPVDRIINEQNPFNKYISLGRLVNGLMQERRTY